MVSGRRRPGVHRLRIYVDNSVFGGVFDEQYGYPLIQIHSPLELPDDGEDL